MATAYTAGLRVSSSATVRKERKLPLLGEVLVKVGDRVAPDTVLAKAERPGLLSSLHLADKLGVDAEALQAALLVKEGDFVEEGQLLGEHKSFFGMFTSRVVAPHAGTVEFISAVTGNLGLRRAPTPLELKAFISGEVLEVLPEQGAVLEAKGAFVQGIFGVGGEAVGEIALAVESPDEVLESLPEQPEGKVLIAGAGVSDEVLAALLVNPPAALVLGSLVDSQLASLLGTELGIAITGKERLGMTVVLTEGFGQLAMANRTFKVFAGLVGKQASVSGATQIRAGVLRPEVIVPLEGSEGAETSTAGTELAAGARIRLIREPYFGMLGRVIALPEQPAKLETGAIVRVLEAELDSGSKVLVPRANVELFED